MKKERLEELRQKARTIQEFELLSEVDRLRRERERHVGRIRRQRRSLRSLRESKTSLYSQVLADLREEERRSERAWLLVVLYAQAFQLMAKVKEFPPKESPPAEIPVVLGTPRGVRHWRRVLSADESRHVYERHFESMDAPCDDPNCPLRDASPVASPLEGT